MTERKYCFYVSGEVDCLAKNDIDELIKSNGSSVIDYRRRTDLIKAINNTCDNCNYKNRRKPTIVVDSSENIR